MADKKITDLSEMTTDLDQSDLFVVVDNPGGTPITKKISTTNLFGNVSFLTSVSYPTAILMRSTVTANTSTNSTGVVAAGSFTVNTTATGNVAFQYGLTAATKLSGATANVTTEHAAGLFTVDVSNAASLIANTFGVVVRVANTGARTQNTTAFLSLQEASTGNTTTSTVFALDLLNITANTSVGANSAVMYSNCATSSTANRKLKIQVNGETIWILASNVAPA